ncbi:hypothetical protein GMMP13_930006 [Candidatus Magnetomoraceae bacterium gMMP-13]
MSENKTILTGGGPYIKLWETKTADLIDKIQCSQYLFDTDSNFILVNEKNEIYAINLSQKEKNKIQIPFSDLQKNILLSNSGKFLIFLQNFPKGLKIWSLTEKKQIGSIFDFKINYKKKLLLTNDGESLVTFYKDKNNNSICIWNVKKGQFIKKLVNNNDAESLDFIINEDNNRIYTLEKLPDGKFSIVIWELDTGKFIFNRILNKNIQPYGIVLSSDGYFLIIEDDFENPIRVLKSTDLLQSTQTPLTSNGLLRYILLNENKKYLSWPDGPFNSNNTYLWDITKEHQPKLIKDFSLSTSEGIIVHPDGKHAIVIRKTDHFELWDISDKAQKIKNLSKKNRMIKTADFTLDGHTISATLKDGSILFFDINTGEYSAKIHNINGNDYLFYYIPDSQCIHIWTDTGLVLRYIKGFKVYGFWFASGKCLSP